mgnify:CR=1 FL=1
MSVKLITTEDGSHSLYHEELKETYHSFHGAFKESIHVFMLYGLDSWLAQNAGKRPVRVFEVGFGTGLNAWLSLVWADQNQIPMLYHTIEPFPLDEEIYSQLNYGELDENIAHYRPHLKMLHKASWDQGTVLTEYFNMKKDKATLEDVQLYPMDVVFYDAFAPKKQPEMWEKNLFQKIFDQMRPGGVLTTYCATGQLRRDLKEVGFEVEKLPGPPGKKEMTRAWKQ